MVTMDTAEQALKILYLGVISNQLNVETDPLWNYINPTTKNVVGKEVRKMTSYGVNGGVGAGTEVGPLPASGGNRYKQFVTDLKNLYGTINISDKSIKASRNNAGAFVNLLQGELTGLLEASKFNLARQLYGDGTGVLAHCKENTNTNTLEVDSVQYMIEGITIDICDATGTPITNGSARRVEAIDRVNNKIVLNGDVSGITTTTDNIITMQQSFNQEIQGLEKIFQRTGTLYGVDRSTNYWMQPYMVDDVGIISDIKIQKMLDDLSEIYGSNVNFLVCSSGVKRSYQQYMEATKRNVNTLDLKGGFKSISYNGIPLHSTRFAPSGTLRGLNTKDFELHQMGDWEWMQGENGRILKQVQGYPTFTATLVKYAEIMCNHPGGQGQMSGIEEDNGIQS